MAPATAALLTRLEIDAVNRLDRLPESVSVPTSQEGATTGADRPPPTGRSSRWIQLAHRGMGEDDVIGGSTCAVNGIGRLTTTVISRPNQVDLSKQVAAVGFDPTDPTLQTQGNQGVCQPAVDACTAACTSHLKSAPQAPFDLTRLLIELATLPPDQRAAIAALLTPPSAPTAPAPLDDRVPWERDSKEGGTQ